MLLRHHEMTQVELRNVLVRIYFIKELVTGIGDEATKVSSCSQRKSVDYPAQNRVGQSG